MLDIFLPRYCKLEMETLYNVAIFNTLKFKSIIMKAYMV